MSDDGTGDSIRASQELQGEAGTGNQLPAQHLPINQQLQVLPPLARIPNAALPLSGDFEESQAHPRFTSQEVTKTESESETWDTQSREQQWTNRELEASLKLGKEAEGKDKALGTVINRWLGKFHISQQNPSLSCNLAEDFQTRKGLLTKG